MFTRILLISAMVGILLAISPWPVENNWGMKAKKPAVEKGDKLYDDKNLTVYIRDRVLTISGPGTGGPTRITLPSAYSRHATGRPEYSKARIRRNADILLVTAEGTVYAVRLGPKTVLQSVYPDPACTGDKIIVDKNKNVLYLYKKGELAKIYSVSTGIKAEYTPEGQFSVVNKFSLPNNTGNELLGPRWLGISVPDEFDLRAERDQRAPKGIKYGIHGTNEPHSIGTYASGGCIRLNNRDIMEIFNLVDVGTPVEIIR